MPPEKKSILAMDKMEGEKDPLNYLTLNTHKKPFAEGHGYPTYLWLVLGEGGYNKVWTSHPNYQDHLVAGDPYEGPWVLKYPIPSQNPTLDAMNERNRAVRLWNEINDQLPKAGIHKLGWVAPFIPNTRQATDLEIANKSIQIYCKKGRIVIDAATSGNFLTRTDTGEVILVDMDLALRRRDSLASINFAKNLNERFNSYWTDPSLQQNMPITLEVTRNLLYLETQLGQEDILLLCDSEAMTLENIRALTWLRIQNKALDLDLFQTIATLNEASVPVNEALLDELSKGIIVPPSPKGEKTAIMTSLSNLFFATPPTTPSASGKNRHPFLNKEDEDGENSSVNLKSMKPQKM